MGSRLTAKHLLAIYPDPNTVTKEQAEEYLPHLVNAMVHYDITTKPRVAMLLANLGEESGELVHFYELWDPTPDQETYEGRADLGNTEPGDGYRFRGHGWIQITGRANHRTVGEALGIDVEGNPDILATPKYAALSAAWFWTHRGNNWHYDEPDSPWYQQWPMNLNEFADAGDFDATCFGVNGGWRGYDKRVRYYDKAMEVLPDDLDLGEAAEPVTEYEQVTLRVAENNYLLREGTEEWARTPDLLDRELKTDSAGWVYAEDI